MNDEDFQDQDGVDQAESKMQFPLAQWKSEEKDKMSYGSNVALEDSLWRKLKQSYKWHKP